jgi:hypothetical protein
LSPFTVHFLNLHFFLNIWVRDIKPRSCVLRITFNSFASVYSTILVKFIYLLVMVCFVLFKFCHHLSFTLILFFDTFGTAQDLLTRRASFRFLVVEIHSTHILLRFVCWHQGNSTGVETILSRTLLKTRGFYRLTWYFFICGNTATSHLIRWKAWRWSYWIWQNALLVSMRQAKIR